MVRERLRMAVAGAVGPARAGSTASIGSRKARHGGLGLSGLLAAIVLAGCGSSADPNRGSGDGPPDGGNGGSGGAVRIGNNFFRSVQNASANPAVDTVAVGDTVTWTWVSTGAVEHSVQSVGAPSFPSSAVRAGSGTAYQVVFQAAGTYRYNCTVHGDEMSGTIIAQ